MRIEATMQTGGSGSSTTSLRKHATEFEGILLTEMLGKLQHTFAQSESDGSGDSAADTISSMGTQALAQALAQRNVLGIGRMVAQALTGDTTEVTDNAVNSPGLIADENSSRAK